MNGSIGRRPAVRAGRGFGIILLAVVSAGCVATSPSPPASPTIGATGIPTSRATPSPTAAGLPTAAWAGIHWTRVPTTDPVWGPPPDPMSSADPNVMDNGWTVVGWSRGYLGFHMVITMRPDNSWTKITATAASSDAIHWQAGGSFGQSGSGSDPSGGSMVGGIVEGPNGLLAYSTEMITCSSPDTFSYPIAVSADGATWQTVEPPAESIQVLDGSSAGYLAVGTSGVFTSPDGMAWEKSDLAGGEFAGLDLFGGGVAFDGGFVIAGVARGLETDGCGSPLAPLQPSVWLSASGLRWTSEPLPGTVAGVEASIAVCVVNDHVLVANEISGDAVRAWTSLDGAAWSASPHIYRCPEFGHKHSARAARTLVYDYREDGSVGILAVGDDLGLTELAQDGELPAWDTLAAEPVLGPAGLIATNRAGTIWIGVPTDA